MSEHSTPDWVSHLIGWHIYPLGFCGAPTRGDHAWVDKHDEDGAEKVTHRLRHLLGWLDYVQELGFNAIQLGPIFDSASHGYDTVDFFRIDPRLGDEEDFLAFTRAAHERGIKVLADGVFNHVSEHHPSFLRALEDQNCEEAQLFRIDYEQDPPQAECFEGHGALVNLNHDSPEVAKRISEVMIYWGHRGIDGWRLDAAYAVPPAFWSKVLPQVRDEHPEVFVYGEVIHGDYAAIAEESGMDSVTQYELWKALWSSLKEKNFFELQWNLDRHKAFLDSFVPVTFIGNHDVTRIATQIGAEKALLAAVVLFTVGGVPLVYYGDEQGYTGLKEEREGGDDQIRPAMPDSPEELSPLGEHACRVYHQLIALRRTYPWLHTARTEIDVLENEHLVYRSINQEGEGHLQVELDIRDTPRAVVRDATGTEILSIS